jgi:hypothetical protein
MKRSLTKNLILMSMGALLGCALFARFSPAQEHRSPTGYKFWSMADDNLKVAYLLGYDDAEAFYRFGMEKELKTLSTDSGKAWIEEFERRTPMPENMTIKQNIQGIDEFYRNWKNQSVQLHYAQIIVRLQIAGKPQSEIEEATRRARAASNQ